MSEHPSISDAEWEVMKVLWAKSPAPAEHVASVLAPKTGWKPKTVMTLLNRLVKKNAAGYEKKGRAFHYFPLVKEAECIRAESRSFLQRVFNGAVTPMLAQFMQEAKLSKAEIEELKQILEKKK
jgi:BlaI family transcriptional regulator, penicillinase repressor